MSPLTLALNKGDQFVIRPNTADLRLDISQSRSIRVNNVGKDIFGGIYTRPGATNPAPSPDNNNSNLFETLGKLIGYVETNDKKASANAAASAEKLADIRKDNNTALLSRLEDADLGELLNELKQSELIYEAVARSSRMINQMSILNY
ncbi:flagellar hook-associated protein FlgL, partial [Aduncisulcus paluster]